MDKKTKKELINEWRQDKPEIGIIGIWSKSTGEVFLDTSLNTAVEFNCHKFQMELGNHPNKELMNLYKANGIDDLEYIVVDTLEYKKSPEDYQEDLMVLLKEHLEKSDKNHLLDMRKIKKIK